MSGVPGGFFEVTGKEGELDRIMEGIANNDGRLTADSSASLDLWLEMKEEWFRIHDASVQPVLQHCWKADEGELLTETFCGQTYDPENNAEHRASATMDEANSRPVCAVCHRRAMHHYAKQLRERKTAWMHLERIIWRDRVTGEVRTEGDKCIEVVTMSGDVLVQDNESGTHRMIRPTDVILATLGGEQ